MPALNRLLEVLGISSAPMEYASRQLSVQQHSPCVGVCALDQQTGWCLGCGRSMDEISRWATMAPVEQRACWDDIPRRLDLLSRPGAPPTVDRRRNRYLGDRRAGRGRRVPVWA